MTYITGGNCAVFYSTDTTNKLPTSADFTLIPGLTSFPKLSSESEAVKARNSETGEQIVLNGDNTIPDFDLTLNWMAFDPIHRVLEDAQLAGTLLQFKSVLYSDAAHTSEYYEIYNARVLKVSYSGDSSSVVTCTVNLSVNGKVIARSPLPAQP